MFALHAAGCRANKRRRGGHSRLARLARFQLCDPLDCHQTNHQPSEASTPVGENGTFLGALFPPKIPVLPFLMLNENPRGTWHLSRRPFFSASRRTRKHLFLLVWRSTAIADVSPLVRSLDRRLFLLCAIWAEKDASLLDFSVTMVRYGAAATSSWLLAALVLALASTSSHHGAWAIDVDARNEDEDHNSGTDGPVWSFPEAIVKATGQEPIVQWKEYLSKDPFGEQAIAPASIYPNKPLSGPGLNWVGIRGKWAYPMGSCPYGGSLDVDSYGKEKCLTVGQAICKNGWRFGIRYHVDNTYLMLWREDDPAYPVYKWFVGATSLCIGEQYPNVAYMQIVYSGGDQYYLIGPSAGSTDHLVRLKIVPDTDKYKANDVIVKFRDGPGDQNALWQIFANGFSQTSPLALWYPINIATNSPTSSPTASPTESPTGNPTASPTGNPTAVPTGSPTLNPTSNPTRSPTANPT